MADNPFPVTTHENVLAVENAIKAGDDAAADALVEAIGDIMLMRTAARDGNFAVVDYIVTTTKARYGDEFFNGELGLSMDQVKNMRDYEMALLYARHGATSYFDEMEEQAISSLGLTRDTQAAIAKIHNLPPGNILEELDRLSANLRRAFGILDDIVRDIPQARDDGEHVPHDLITAAIVDISVANAALTAMLAPTSEVMQLVFASREDERR